MPQFLSKVLFKEDRDCTTGGRRSPVNPERYKYNIITATSVVTGYVRFAWSYTSLPMATCDTNL